MRAVHVKEQADYRGGVAMTHRAAGRAGQLPCCLSLLLQGSDAPVPSCQLHTAKSRGCRALTRDQCINTVACTLPKAEVEGAQQPGSAAGFNRHLALRKAGLGSGRLQCGSQLRLQAAGALLSCCVACGGPLCHGICCLHLVLHHRFRELRLLLRCVRTVL